MHRVVFWILLSLALGARPVAAGVELHPVGRHGAYLGFDLRLEGQVIAPVRFSSNGLIVADRLKEYRFGRAATLRFFNLRGKPGSGLRLVAGGPCPFYFLTVSMPQAEAGCCTCGVA